MANTYFDTITENRRTVYQLTADDVGPKTWAQYRQLCDNIAKAAWDTMNGRAKDDNVVGVSLAGLFAFFGLDNIKALPAYQRRIIVACVDKKRMRSDTMKAAYKAKNEAMKALNEALESDDENVDTTALQTAYEAAKEEITRLKAIPGNEWFDPIPMLDKDKKHATQQCRKYIEDAICDFVTEREFMTSEQLAEEALALKMQRKAREQLKKEAEAKAKAEAQAQTESN